MTFRNIYKFGKSLKKQSNKQKHIREIIYVKALGHIVGLKITSTVFLMAQCPSCGGLRGKDLPGMTEHGEVGFHTAQPLVWEKVTVIRHVH